MTRLTEQLAEDHAQASTAQAQIRNNRRTIHHDLTPRIHKTNDEPKSFTEIDDAIAIASDVPPVEIPVPHAAITLYPLDLPAEQFRSGLDRRKQNRELLMDWLRNALVDGVDFGRVHIASKDRCEHARAGRVRDCSNQYHWSKPSLFKPGAEKISGMLGMTVHYPSLPAFENAILSGVQLTQVVLRCELHDAHGQVVAEGVGARNLAQDYGDLNKALKMAEKSSHIDATLRLAGLSEVFTQDLEDRPAIDDSNEQHDDLQTQKSNGSAKTTKHLVDKGVVFPARNSGKQSSAPSAPPITPPPSFEVEIIGQDDVAIVRNRIAEIGITEKRVLAWLYKVTKGTVTRFDQLNVTQCASLLKRLDIWAQEMAAQPI